jgi:hypothetical protein
MSAHVVYGKSNLARHIGEPHAQAEPGRVAFEVAPLAERKRWTLRELRRAHDELHAGIPAEAAR